jgi:site-specific recombinase XerC
MKSTSLSVSLSTATDEFLRSAADGLTRDPSGMRYSSQALEELRIALRGHVAEELGDIPLGALRRWQVQAFVNELAGSGLAPRRLRAILAALRALTRYAREQGLLDEDPTQGVIVPTEDGHQPRTFTTTDQLETVQPAPTSPMIPDAALWQLMKVVTVVFILIALVLAAESI